MIEIYTYISSRYIPLNPILPLLPPSSLISFLSYLLPLLPASSLTCFLSYLLPLLPPSSFLHKCLHYITLPMITVMRLSYLSSFSFLCHHLISKERKKNLRITDRKGIRKESICEGRDEREKEG